MDYKPFQDQLNQRKREIMDTLDANKRGFASDRVSGELSQYDNHPADSGTELFEREKDLALSAHLKEELADIDYALNQIEQGTYGVCEVTGQKIPMERLEALPTARTIKEASPHQSLAKDRPVEEDVMEESDTGFHRHGRGYDEQDTYQQVASFNDTSMTYEGASLEGDENQEGFVEAYESFASTGIEGYTGDDDVKLLRNRGYKEYMDEQEDIEENKDE
ncbi:TraR/DksA C4-type zinc finger protein [Thalassobacillus sp. CUG 92003]|uniref:TraR/DksA C4-type zinc finger protein n=1 Tax=Thalassobacillus sp. CUG 92003 TaxID=2736641 RepID=UPI0015E695D3|nr:TraR/DksA C4-type zinc finger protein [Thalassobacillus sp. CUG 92003]